MTNATNAPRPLSSTSSLWPFEVKFLRTSRPTTARGNLLTVVRFSIDRDCAWADARALVKAEGLHAIVQVRELTAAEAQVLAPNGWTPANH